MKTSHLYGITLTNWLRLLRKNQFRVHLPYLHRAAAITAGSAVNSCLGALENLLYGRAIASVTVDPEPMFVIGHWRSGTTLLQTLLSVDPQLATPNTYEVLFPHTFLTTEAVGTRLLARFVSPTRVEGDMPLSLSGPKEDEIALSVSSLCSLYLAVIFPQNEHLYRRYLTLREISPGELRQWKSAYLRFIKKLTLQYRRRLVLKSPPHTARIRVLLSMFPDARFVHVYRDPFSVFRSCRGLYAAWYRQSAFLQRPTPGGMDERILSLYTDMYNGFFDDLPLIHPDQYCEIRYEDLRHDPMGSLSELYNKMKFPGFTAAEPRLQQYIATRSSCQSEVRADLDRKTRETVARAWKRNFDVWGYPT